MAVTLLGQHECVIGPGEKGPLRLWPENGFVCVEDSRDNTYKELDPRQALVQIKGIHDMIGNSTDEMVSYAKLTQYQRFVSRVLGVIQTAKNQANWKDPACFRDAARKAPKHFVMPRELPRRRDF